MRPRTEIPAAIPYTEAMSWFTLTVEVPALDRLLDWLDASQQDHIDALTAKVVSVTTSLADARKALELKIAQEKR